MNYLVVRERESTKGLHGLDGIYGPKRWSRLSNAHQGETHDMLSDLAKSKTMQGRPSDAADILSVVLEGRKSVLGETHPLTQRTLRELADLQRRTGLVHAAKEMLHENNCHGYGTRHITTSREHAARMHMVDNQLKGTSRLAPLECDLAASMQPGKSFSTGCLNQFFLRRGAAEARKKPVAVQSPENRKGRRLTQEEAEEVLFQFAIVLLTKYENVEAAFKAFDINGNGTLSGSEFSHYAKFIWSGDSVAVFKALDDNRGGDISIEEFKILEKMYKDWRKSQGMGSTGKSFRSATTDKLAQTR
jgi:hypothetical protein